MRFFFQQKGREVKLRVVTFQAVQQQVENSEHPIGHNVLRCHEVPGCWPAPAQRSFSDWEAAFLGRHRERHNTSSLLQKLAKSYCHPCMNYVASQVFGGQMSARKPHVGTAWAKLVEASISTPTLPRTAPSPREK
jgi:hypothetical protein